MISRAAFGRLRHATRAARWAFSAAWHGIDEPAAEPAPEQAAPADLVGLALAPVVAVLDVWAAMLGASRKES